MSNYSNTNNEITNTLASLIRAIDNNTNTIEQYLADIQVNGQFQGSTDRTSVRDIGNNRVNVINYIDPDTLSTSLANNESAVAAIAEAVAQAISESVILELRNYLIQLGLINVAEQ